jgi:oligoribonuclease NrnB/cAMP/cGMP phosphodiesterase (DHH superfamily)
MKILVVHHDADYDGLFSGCVAGYFLGKHGHKVLLQGWDFGDDKVEVAEDIDQVYILDLPFDCIARHEKILPTVWIDHHKSSIDKWGQQGIDGFQMDGVAACRLAWQYFNNIRPSLEDFKSRMVQEPSAIRLAGEYDVWDKSDPMAESFQFGLKLNSYTTVPNLSRFIRLGSDGEVKQVCEQGETAMKWQKAYAAEACASKGYTVELGGLTFWCLVSVHARNSMWFPSVPQGIDGLMCCRLTGKGTVGISLYHNPGREDLDLSPIAVSFGGGGHRGACGFQISLEQATSLGILK